MDGKRASEVLRGEKATEYARVEAQLRGAEALEAWAVVQREGQMPRFTRDGKWRFVYQKWDGVVIAGEGATPLAAVLDAMEKEKG